MNVDTLITATYSNKQVDKNFLDCVYEECGAEQPNITHPVLVFSIYGMNIFLKHLTHLKNKPSCLNYISNVLKDCLIIVHWMISYPIQTI